MAWKQSITVKKLAQVSASCKKTALTADDTLFFKTQNGKWSIAENLVHLAKSAKAVNRALSMPKEQMLVAFGKPNHASRDFKTVFQVYKTFLAKGGIATNPFSPQITEGDTKQGITELFDNQHNIYIALLKNFTETDLDNYQMPHPALGNLTIREMGYFMVFHIEHHENTIKNILLA